MGDRVEELAGKVLALLGICDGARSRESMRAVFPEYSDAEMCQALVQLCERGAVSLGPAGAALVLQEVAASAAEPGMASQEVAAPSGESETAPQEDREEFSAEPSAGELADPSEEPQSEWAPEITGETLLLGVEAPRDYSSTYLPAEEIDSFIAGLGFKDSMRSASSSDTEGPSSAAGASEPSGFLGDAVLDFLSAAAPEQTEGEPSEQPKKKRGAIAYGTSVKHMGLSDYAAERLISKGMNRVEEVVVALGPSGSPNHGSQRCFREARKVLAEEAVCLPWALDDSQLGVLRSTAKSTDYVFDLFGVLCHAQESDARAQGEEEGDPFDPYAPESSIIPIERLFLSPALVGLLKENNVDTVGDIVYLGRSGLLSMRSFGENKTRVVLDALERGLRPEKRVDRVPLSAFESEYSSEAVFLTGLLEQALSGRSYPLLHDPFVAMVLPKAAEQLETSDAEHAFEPLLAELESSDRLVLACHLELSRKLRKLRKRAQKGADGEDLFAGVPCGSAWDAAAERLVQGDSGLRFDGQTRRISVVKPTLSGWVATLKDVHRAALEMRLAGRTLQECGEELGVTRERVRQITTKALKGRPALAEDDFLPLFEAYFMTSEQFAAVTGQPPETYEYLSLVASTKRDERAPLELALDDPSVDEAMRERIRGLVDDGFAYVDGRRVPLKRQPVMEALLRRHASDKSISVGELLEHYRAFMEEHGMEDGSVFEENGQRALSASLERWDFSMVCGRPADDDGVRRDIRFFDWNAKDFKPLRDYLGQWAKRDIECSTALLMCDEEGARIAADLGLHDEYELHSVLRRGIGELWGMDVRKRPMVRFGNGDRASQVLDLIRELGPADAYVLADGYCDRYGVSPATFRGSFLKDFRIYENDGIYQYAESELTGELKSVLEGALLGHNYVPMSAVRARCAPAFPEGAPAIGATVLSELGYHVSGDLAVRDGVDEVAMFGELIDGRRTFGIDDEGFGDEVFRNESFKAALNRRIRAYEVVEYLKDRFLNVEMVLGRGDMPMGKDDLRDYTNAALAFMEPGRPYSVRSLRQAGFHHKVSALRDRLPESGDYFFGSLIATGYVGERVKLTSLNGVYLFCRRPGPFSSPDLVAYMAGDEPIDEETLRMRLSAEHGIDIDLSALRSLCRRAGVTLAGSPSQDDGDEEGQEAF